MTKDELIAFEARIAERFNNAEIHYPVHLSGGNEDQLIEIFKDIRKEDWVIGTWRSHYHCLLKGVPPGQLEAAILDGRSIALCFPQHRVLCSAIAGGGIPIALGIAMGLVKSAAAGKVWCFLGDMVSFSGIFQESSYYAGSMNLPLRWIVEDNGVSVCTPTHDIWGIGGDPDVEQYSYDLKWPHAGAGIRVQF